MTNILLVDDRPENLLALEAILEPLDQTLLYAHSGEEALRQLLHHNVAVILLDVQMPLLDGFETAMLIKQRERTKHIPIITAPATGGAAEGAGAGRAPPRERRALPLPRGSAARPDLDRDAKR